MVASRPPDEEPAGLAGRLSPQVASGLQAISRVARALNAPGTLEELALHALGELKATLGLSAAALYLPLAGPRPILRRYVRDERDGAAPEAREELIFDEEAWRFAVASGHPIVFQEAAGWLIDNPFQPEARFWLALPLVATGRLVGVLMAARDVPVDLDAVTLTVLTLLGEQLSAGIATARLRQELQRTAIERERMRLVADVHDGLAQDLALAMREVALLESDPAAQDAGATIERLREAVADAHRLVRARLVDLSGPAPLGGLRAALDEVCERSRRRGLPVALHAPDDLVVAPAVTAAVLRVLSEALSNAERHAGASSVDVWLVKAGDALELRVRDDGRGFAGPAGEGARSPDGHFGLTLMRERADEVGGRLTIESSPGAGTTVVLRLALPST